MTEPLAIVVGAARDLAAALLRPDRRIFLPHLLAAGLLATWVWARHVRGRRGLLGYLFPREVWLHRSAREDYALIALRAVVRAAFVAPMVIATVPLAAKIAMKLAAIVGPSPLPALPRALAMGAFTVAAFVADDFTRFLLHLLAHRVPVLWELHKVHHSAEVLTPFTVHRVHPLEAWLNGLRGAATTAVVAGLFAWALPGRVGGFDVLGVGALGFVWSLAGSNLRHSQVWLSYGRALEHIFISPAQHQIHHSREPRHYDRNFGSALALWDWMFSTLYVPRARERLSFGLPDDVRNHRPGVVAMVVDPVVAAARRLTAHVWPRLSVGAERSK
jgi:sterol desaturase/sphingolipid hydroxylase (fatty acid hydroxylase superfamily)